MPQIPAVHAPFAFIPVNEKVYFPTENGHSAPSHDLPFEDGISGSIKLKLTAKTPIIVAGEKVPKDNNEPQKIYPMKLDVLKSDGSTEEKYGFEGSSLRGAIREIVEIVSFGKISRYNPEQRWIRDLNSKIYKDSFTQKIDNPITQEFKSKVHTGWLFTDNDEKWKFLKCSNSRLDISTVDFLPTEKKKYTLEEKYNSINGLPNVELLKTNKFEGNAVIDNQPIPQNHTHKTLLYSRVYCFKRPTINLEPENNLTKAVAGTLVMTASMNHQKHMEWVFHTPSATEAIKIADPSCINESKYTAIKAFVDKYHLKSGNDNNVYKEWNFRYKQYVEKEISAIPIFYVTEDGTADGVIRGMGLTQLFHLSPKQSRADQLGDEHSKHELDLAETIFGVKNDSEQCNSIAGRVRFKNVIATNVPAAGLPFAGYKVVLEAPREYAPLYGQQTVNSPKYLGKTAEIITQLHDNFKLKRKIYPRRPFNEVIYTPLKAQVVQMKDENPESTSILYPLPVGTTFETEVVFHNLRPFELGALLWALELGPYGKGRCHAIGMGQPFGFGQLHVAIEREKSIGFVTSGQKKNPFLVSTYISIFSNEILAWTKNYLKIKCTSISQIPATLTLLKLVSQKHGDKIQDYFGIQIWNYMKIINANGGNDFAAAKNAKCVLPDYTDLYSYALDNRP